MSDSEISFDNQDLSIESEMWNVILKYESCFSETKEIKSTKSDIIIALSESGEYDSILKLNILDNSNKLQTCIISGIDGGSYLHKSDEKDNSQSVKIDGNNLILSLGFTFLSIDLSTLTLNWNIRPDMAEVFEFYDLQNDYLLRGELEIHRINKQGNLKWSFGGRDIWVNMEGKPEVQIEDNAIRLLDFDSNEYLIDFNGKTLEDNPVKPKRKWWQLNK